MLFEYCSLINLIDLLISPLSIPQLIMLPSSIELCNVERFIINPYYDCLYIGDKDPLTSPKQVEKATIFETYA